MLLSDIKNISKGRILTADSESPKRIMIDFDKTIHAYTKGWLDGSAYDRPIDGCKRIIDKLRDQGYEIVLFTTRLCEGASNKEEVEKQEKELKDWLQQYDIAVDNMTGEKLPADVYIDDRSIQFNGIWDDNLLAKIYSSILQTQDQLPQIDFQGIKISIENRKGSNRYWEDEEGNKGKTKMFYPYGYINSTEGTDGDEIDVFVGSEKDSADVYVIRHMIDGEYDEDKVMLGFSSKENARDAFLAHYNSADHLGEIKEMSLNEFRELLENHEDGTKIAE